MQVETLFIGGGTPTCLPAEDLSDILAAARRNFHWHEGAEVTVEANPGTVDTEKLRILRDCGVNRLSIGVQSCREDTLRLLGRVHNFSQAEEAVAMARKVGFSNISLDLIFGVPGQTEQQWLDCLHRIVSLQPEHVSAYGLQIEEGTPLYMAVERGELQPCPEEEELAMFRQGIELLRTCRYEHYEISNFARPGHRCRNNLRYWENLPYLGLGPAAHSYLHGQRFSNTKDVLVYVRELAEGKIPVAASERIDLRIEMAETVFLGLRLIEGMNLQSFAARFGRQVEAVYGPELEKLLKLGLVEIGGGRMKLTPKGLPLANRVFAEFV